MTALPRPLPQPKMQRAAGDVWTLLEDYRYDDPERGGALVVRAGTRWNRASVPRAVRWCVDNDDCREAAPLLHDELYGRGGRVTLLMHAGGVVIRLAVTYTRAEADALFRRVMLADGVPRWKAWAAWAAVRAGGAPHWGGDGARVQAAMEATP